MAKQYASNQPQGYNNHLQNIAIVGVSGTIGKHITESLLQTGKHNLTAITRKGSPNKAVSGVTVQEVDYADPASLVGALQGQHCLIITLGVLAAPDTQEKLIQAAAEAKVRWVLPNAWGGDPPAEAGRDMFLAADQQKTHATVERLGVSGWVAVCCGFWFEFSLAGAPNRYGFDLKNRKLTFFDDGEVKMNTATWAQTGRGVAALLSLKVLPDDETDSSLCLENFRNRFCYISSFYVSQRDMFASVLRVTGSKESDWQISTESAKERYESARAELQKGNRAAFEKLLYSRAFYPDAPHDCNSKVNNEDLGLPKEDLDEVTKTAIKMHEDGVFEQRYG